VYVARDCGLGIALQKELHWVKLQPIFNGKVAELILGITVSNATWQSVKRIVVGRDFIVFS
jgi:hypothetical protein